MADPQYSRFFRRPAYVPDLIMVGSSSQSHSREGLKAHQHPGVMEICMIRRGVVDWWTDEETYIVRDRNIYISYPGELHGSVGRVLQPCELLWFQLRWTAQNPPAFLDKQTGSRLRKALYALPSRMFRASDQTVALFENLLEEHREPGPEKEVMSEAILKQLLVRLIRDGQGDQQNFSTVVSRAMRWMSEQGDMEYMLEDVAQAVGMSVSRLQARFKKEAGCALGEYRTRLAMARARRLLTTTSLSITDIAMQLGFSTSQYFATVFGKHNGVTPRVYRKQRGVELG